MKKCGAIYFGRLNSPASSGKEVRPDCSSCHSSLVCPRINNALLGSQVRTRKTLINTGRSTVWHIAHYRNIKMLLRSLKINHRPVVEFFKKYNDVPKQIQNCLFKLLVVHYWLYLFHTLKALNLRQLLWQSGLNSLEYITFHIKGKSMKWNIFAAKALRKSDY